MNTPIIPVSWGELLDKMAILDIKSHRLRGDTALKNVRRERDLLRKATSWPTCVVELQAALLAVNLRLWRIEDMIREKEAKQDFGAVFVTLARAVYQENDERGRIKQALNRMLGSALVEEKQYPSYNRPIASGENAARR